MDLEPAELIGRGRVADVHAFGHDAVKLFHAGTGKSAAFSEAVILADLEPHRLPVPRVHAVRQFGDRWGLVMDRVTGAPLGAEAQSGRIPVEAALGEMIRLQRQLHATREPRLLPLKQRLANRIDRITQLDTTALLARLAALPDGDAVCHGDFHPFNILGPVGEGIVVDWLDATAGPPAADACRSYLLLHLAAPDLAGPYLAHYAAAAAMREAEILTWLPCLAAARLAEGIETETETLLRLAREP